jgi:adenylate cyclase
MLPTAKPLKPWKRGHREIIGRLTLLVLVVGAAVAGAGWAGWLKGPENFYGDLWHQLAGVRYQPEHVVIVALDEATLQKHPEPLVCWTPHFARTIEVLRRVGARIIGLDYLFLISIETWLRTLDLPPDHQSLNYDEPFKEQLTSGQVILGAQRTLDEQQRQTMVLPIREYLEALPRPGEDVGLLNLYNDADGTIRRFVPALRDDYGRVRLTMGKVLALRALEQDPGGEISRMKHDPALQVWSTEAQGNETAAVPLIGFVGPPNTFPRLSMERFLKPGTENDPEIRGLKNKVVIIAFEPRGLQDIHPTPYSLSLWPWPGGDMSGPEIHANIVETLLTGKFPRPVAVSLTTVYLLALIITGCLMFYRLPPLPALGAGVILGMLAGLLAYLLFCRYWLLATAEVQLGLLLSYGGVLGIKFTGEERERRRLRKIFSRYVDDEVVEKLLASGTLPDLGGEVNQVTVLFADIRNFTTISEKLNPHQVVEMLNHYLSQACESIVAQGGTVDKFIGDAVMAVFGAPVPYPDHARRAVLAALDMAARAQELGAWMKRHFPGEELPAFAIGIGLNTGEAIIGNIGSPKRLEFTAIGDTVNVASRLESLTKELGWQIVASRSTIEAGRVVTGRQAIRMVKGRQEPLEVFEVLKLQEA